MTTLSGSHTALCIGAAPPDPEGGNESHPPGVALAERLIEVMRAAGLGFSPPDNRRGVGWSSLCELDDVRVELSVSTSDQVHWSIRISAMPSAIRPTVVSRETVARGRHLSFQAATAIQRLLSATFQSVVWTLDADQSRGAGSPHPVLPE